jgi:4-hydroxy-4-methyl-2-oxoglutarate aldolase
MLEEPPILTIRRNFQRPTQAQIDALSTAPTGHIVDAMEGRGAMDHEIKPQDDEHCRFCGPALTAHAYPADNLGLVASLDVVQPGDAVVCANDSYTTTALTGDLVVGMFKNKGAIAIVTDGAVRDQDGIEPWHLPMFRRAVTPNSPSRFGPGTVGLPVTCGGVPVESGDMVIGDRDGVVIVPFAMIDTVIERVAKIKVAEVEMENKVKAGMTAPGYLADLIASDKVREVE